MPSLEAKLWMPSARALRGRPASTSSTRRRDLASVSAPLSPAGPPPTTSASYSIVFSSMAPPCVEGGLLANIVAEVANYSA